MALLRMMYENQQWLFAESRGIRRRDGGGDMYFVSAGPTSSVALNLCCQRIVPENRNRKSCEGRVFF